MAWVRAGLRPRAGADQPRLLDQRLEAAGVPRPRQEGVGQQLRRGGAEAGLPGHARVQEQLQLRGHAAARGRGRAGQRADQLHRRQRRVVKIRRLPVNHLDQEDAQGPDVHLGPVLRPRDHLGAHPVRRAHQRAPPRQLRAHLRAEPEVRELDAAVLGEEDGVALDVSVDDALAVQVGEGGQHLAAHGGHLLLRHVERGHDVGEGAALQVLHGHPQLGPHQVRVQHGDDVGVGVVPHDHHLVEEQLAALLPPEVHLLDGDGAAGGGVGGRHHHARAALADLREVGEDGARVPGAHHLLQRRAELLGGEAGRAAPAARVLQPRRGLVVVGRLGFLPHIFFVFLLQQNTLRNCLFVCLGLTLGWVRG